MRIDDFIRYRVLRRPHTLHVAFDEGEGPTIVLLHGIASSNKTWKPLIRQLDTRKHRVIALDLLGFGKSPIPDWIKYDVSDHTKAVVATLKALKLKGPVTLVGHSMGCLVATHLAHKNPQLVRNLVLYEPPLFIDSQDFAKHARSRKFYFNVYERMMANPQSFLKSARVMGSLANRMTGFIIDEATWLPFERSMRNTIMNQKTYDELIHLKLPTHIIYGRLDLMVIRTEIKDIFKEQKHISFHVVNDIHGVSFWSGRMLADLLEKIA